jgi:hypothetical protein
MICLINFLPVLLDVRGPVNNAGYPIFYVPIGVALTLFAIALGVLLLFRETLSRTVRITIAAVLIVIAAVLMLLSVLVLFI